MNPFDPAINLSNPSKYFSLHLIFFVKVCFYSHFQNLKVKTETKSLLKSFLDKIDENFINKAGLSCSLKVRPSYKSRLKNITYFVLFLVQSHLNIMTHLLLYWVINGGDCLICFHNSTLSIWFEKQENQNYIKLWNEQFQMRLAK